jgi:hypothetical protein
MRCDYTYIGRGGQGKGEWYRALYDWGPVLWVDLEIAVPDIPRSLTFFFRHTKLRYRFVPMRCVYAKRRQGKGVVEGSV